MKSCLSLLSRHGPILAGAPSSRPPSCPHDDLETWADLTDEVIARLRRDDILYDREGVDATDFFQVYTKALSGDGFFLEIVQRRGYGAVSAPVRLAAQFRLALHPAVPRR